MKKLDFKKFAYSDCTMCGRSGIIVYKDSSICLQCEMIREIMKEISFVHGKLDRIESLMERINERR